MPRQSTAKSIVQPQGLHVLRGMTRAVLRRWRVGPVVSYGGARRLTGMDAHARPVVTRERTGCPANAARAESRGPMPGAATTAPRAPTPRLRPAAAQRPDPAPVVESTTDAVLRQRQ